MPRPARRWTPVEIDRLKALHADGKSLHAIAAELDRSKGRISDKAKELGLTWSRDRTVAAAQSRVVDAKARRAALQLKLLVKADELVDQIDAPFLAFNFGGKDNTYTEHRLDRPPTQDIRNLMQSAGVAIDRSLKLAEHDSGSSDAVASLLGGLAERFGLPTGSQHADESGEN